MHQCQDNMVTVRQSTQGLGICQPHRLNLPFWLHLLFPNVPLPVKLASQDFVPSSERGRWNAAESISSMSWSGSAVIGGTSKTGGVCLVAMPRLEALGKLQTF